MLRHGIRHLPGLIAMLGVLYAGSVYGDPSLSQQLVDRITKAQDRLQSVQESIGRESVQYEKALDRKQREIEALRDEAAALQRLTDEKTMGLDKLESRVDEWTTQSNYQKQLLANYVEAVGLPVERSGSADQETQVDARTLGLAVSRIESALSPQWRDRELVMPDGTVAQTPVLRAGPVEVAFDEASGDGGLVVNDAGSEPRLEEVFDGPDLDQLASLQRAGAGDLSFDPTLGNALELRKQGDGFIGHLSKGGIWAIPILFFGGLSFIISVLKGVQFVRLPRIDNTLLDRMMEQSPEEGKANSSPSPPSGRSVERKSADITNAQQKLVQIAASTPVSQQRDDLLVAYLMEHKHKLERFMGVVGTSAAVAPLLGLLGTVSGMISTFKMMTVFGSGDASTVSGGISEALVTTELGLIVAIPSLIVSALLVRKSKSYSHELENFAIKLSKVEFSG